MSARRLAAAIAGAALMLAPAGAARAADPPDPGTLHSSTYESGGLSYPYLVYTPTTLPARRPAPLVVVVHGCQTTAEQQMRATRFNTVAEEHGFAVLYPDVDVTATLMPSALTRCWHFYDPADWHRGVGDAAAIAGMTRTAMAKLGSDPQRVYLIGMSSGAEMATIMARAYPELYAAIGVHSGGPYADPGCLASDQLEPPGPLAQLAYAEMGDRARIVPMFDINGDADTTSLPACAAKVIDQALRVDNLVAAGTQDEPLRRTPAQTTSGQVIGGRSYTVATYRDPAGCVVAERWLVHGMPHYWSGGTTDPAYAAFTDPTGPNAAEAAWRFFARYRLSETDLPCAEARPPRRRGHRTVTRGRSTRSSSAASRRR